MNTLKEQFIAYFGDFNDSLGTEMTKSINGLHLVKMKNKITISDIRSLAILDLKYFNSDMSLVNEILILKDDYYKELNAKEIFKRTVLQITEQEAKNYGLPELVEKINKLVFKVKLENKLQERGIKERTNKI